METLFSILTDPKFISIVGPLGIAAVIEAFAIYRLFSLYDESLQKRLEDWKQMNKDYQDLSLEINRTLDAVLKALGKNNNGNGGI